MRVKHIIIWILGLAVIVFFVNFAGGIFTKIFIEKSMADITRYVRHADTVLFVEDSNESDYSLEQKSKLFELRGFLDDGHAEIDQGIKGLFFFCNPKIDTSVKFSSDAGELDLCEGVWGLVYKENSGTTKDDEYNIGLLSVNDLCGLSCARELYELLADNPDAKVKLNSYAVKGVIIVPLTITVIDQGGNNIGMFECQEAPEDWEKMEAEDTYICNKNSDNEFSVADTLLKAMMEISFQGERAVDKIAKEKLEQVNDGKAISAKGEYSWAFGGFTVSYAGVDGGYSMVVVREFNYIYSVVLYIIILSIIWTLVYIEVFVRKRA